MKESYIAMGRIFQAYAHRADLRAKAKDLNAQLNIAKNNVSNYDMYDDCGPSYNSEYASVKAQFDLMVNLKISADKTCKKLRLDFIEKYPDFAYELNSEVNQDWNKSA